MLQVIQNNEGNLFGIIGNGRIRKKTLRNGIGPFINFLGLLSFLKVFLSLLGYIWERRSAALGCDRTSTDQFLETSHISNRMLG